MARKIKVTPEQLEKAATLINGLAEDYRRLYEQFYKETGAMADSWKGEDNMAFINQIDGFKQDFNNMHGHMQDYVEFLNNSARAYRTTQENAVLEAKKLVN